MSNTIGHRVSTYSKFALGKQQADAEKLSKERRRENISRLVNERNPKLAVDKKRDDEMVERCRDGLKNSYLADFSKIFERVMLWPFVPGLKTGEAVTAGARLVLFSCAAFGLAIVASKKLPSNMAKSFQIFNFKMDTPGIVMVSSILIFPSIFYYIVQKLRLKMCLNKAKKNSIERQTIITDAEKKIDSEVQGQYLSNLYEHNSQIASENLLREPIRQKSALGGHPGVPGIL